MGMRGTSSGAGKVVAEGAQKAEAERIQKGGLETGQGKPFPEGGDGQGGDDDEGEAGGDGEGRGSTIPPLAKLISNTAESAGAGHPHESECNVVKRATW